MKMALCSLEMFAVLVLLVCGLAQGQDYVLPGHANRQYQQYNTFQNNYINRPSSSFNQLPSINYDAYNPYLQQRDLQTSDIPFEFQKILPQYRFSSKTEYDKDESPYSTLFFDSNKNQPNRLAEPNRLSQNYFPSTHRPDYSHLLTKNYHVFEQPKEEHKYSIQQPPYHTNFYDHSNKIAFPEKAPTKKPNYLRQRTRILLTPDDEENKVHKKKYFVSALGEVSVTTTTEPPQEKPVRNQKFPHKFRDIDGISSNEFSSGEFGFTSNIVHTSTPRSVQPNQSLRKGKSPETHRFHHPSPPPKLIDNQVDPTEISVKKPDEFYNRIPGRLSVSEITANQKITTYKPQFKTQKTTQNNEQSTESWVVVASVQTSKSISGARYLPSDFVSQKEHLKPLNDKSGELNEDVSDFTESSVDVTTIEEKSTESLIDKLDRVQSDLVSGLLSDFKQQNNNITVISDNSTDGLNLTSMLNLNHDKEKSGLHLPKIRPFNNTRPKLPRRRANETKVNIPKKNPNPHQLLPPDYRHSTDIDNSDNLLKEILNRYKSQSTSKPSKTENKEKNVEILLGEKSEEPSKKSNNITNIDDISALLPPGYKQSDEKESASTEISVENNNASNNTLSKNVHTNTQTTTEKPSLEISKIALDDISKFLPPGYKQNTTEKPKIEVSKIAVDDISKFLPPGYKASTTAKPKIEVSKIALDDISKFLPPGYKASTTEKPNIEVSKIALDDISKFLPPGYKASTTEKSKIEVSKIALDDISKFLPPGYKEGSSTNKPKIEKANIDDISKFLPPGYKEPSDKPEKGLDITKIEVDDISAFLPPGFKLGNKSQNPSTTSKPKTTPTLADLKKKKKYDELFEQSTKDDISALLPKGYKSFTTKSPVNNDSTTVSGVETSISASTFTPSSTPSSPTTKGTGLKIVFPSRPGGVKRKEHKSTTTSRPREISSTKAAGPVIHKGWPTRATTEFTGWPTPLTTPISIGKLLENIRTSSTTETSEEEEVITTPSPTTKKITTTTRRITTPGVCHEDCDLVGTIKLVDGVKWVPELLDKNTKEWQLLANEVQSQLEDVYMKSPTLKKWFKKLTIDGFSEGSVLVDYIIEINSNKEVDTLEMKGLFHDALMQYPEKASYRDAKSLLGEGSEEDNSIETVTLGKFVVDPTFTDFIVVPKHVAPTVGYAEENMLLPQWAIAVIVLGLASLLFVIIFGVTVVLSRKNNAKKKVPVPLSEQMLHELNKKHMTDYNSYYNDNPYNLDDFWESRRSDYTEAPHHKGSSTRDNSTANLYDSWRSDWNGYYNYNTSSNNGYYGGHSSGGRESLYSGRRRYAQDTNF